MTTDEAPNLRTPAEQLPITLFDAVVLAVRAEDGTIYLAIRDVCQALAIDFSTQLRRIRSHAVLAEGLARFRIATAGGAQAQDFLELERVPTAIPSLEMSATFRMWTPLVTCRSSPFSSRACMWTVDPSQLTTACGCASRL